MNIIFYDWIYNIILKNEFRNCSFTLEVSTISPLSKVTMFSSKNINIFIFFETEGSKIWIHFQLQMNGK